MPLNRLAVAGCTFMATGALTSFWYAGKRAEEINYFKKKYQESLHSSQTSSNIYGKIIAGLETELHDIRSAQRQENEDKGLFGHKQANDYMQIIKDNLYFSGKILEILSVKINQIQNLQSEIFENIQLNINRKSKGLLRSIALSIDPSGSSKIVKNITHTDKLALICLHQLLHGEESSNTHLDKLNDSIKTFDNILRLRRILLLVGVDLNDFSSARKILVEGKKCVELGDPEVALKLINKIEGWPRVFLVPWLENARKSLELKQAVEIFQSLQILAELKC